LRQETGLAAGWPPTSAQKVPGQVAANFFVISLGEKVILSSIFFRLTPPSIEAILRVAPSPVKDDRPCSFWIPIFCAMFVACRRPC
jgi:hypothetical protein